jgi:hypothetical protein
LFHSTQFPNITVTSNKFKKAFIGGHCSRRSLAQFGRTRAGHLLSEVTS